MKYMLRVRCWDDRSEWSDPEEFASRKARDRAAAFARAVGGFQTHCFDERRKASQAASSSEGKT